MGVGARRQFISLTQHHWNRDLDSVRYVLVSCHNLESKAIRDEPDNVVWNTMVIVSAKTHAGKTNVADLISQNSVQRAVGVEAKLQ